MKVGGQMVGTQFHNVDNVSTLQHLMQVPIGKDITVTLTAASEGLEKAQSKLREIIERAQEENQAWVTERLETLHKDPQFRLADMILVREDGRVHAMWPSFRSYIGYPKTQPPPTVDQLLGMILEKQMLLYPLTSRRSVWMLCKNELLPFVHDAVKGDIEFFPYGDDGSGITMGYIPDGMLTPSKAKSTGIALGSLGLWAISEKYVDVDKGDQTRIVAYRPRVYLSHGSHPQHTKSVYITPNPRSLTIATGHLPMDERTPSLRVEMAHEESDVIKSIFAGYERDDRVNGSPLVLRYRPYKPWNGFYPMHGGKNRIRL